MKEAENFEKLPISYEIPIKTPLDNYLVVFHDKNAGTLLGSQLNECVKYLEDLYHTGVPVIFNLDHLAFLLKTDDDFHVKYKSELKDSQKKELYWMSKGGKKDTKNESKIWRRTNIKKKCGGTRTLTIPNKKLSIIQRWIYERILLPYYYKNLKLEFKRDFVPKKLQKPFQEKAVHGFLPNKSIVTNAEKHVGQRIIMKIDFKDFFPSISEKRVCGLFKKMGYTPYISKVLAGLCTYDDQLPQGAPSSPMITNLISMKMDLRIYSLCKKYKFRYTRYADDITISGDLSLLHFKNTIFKIIKDENFTISEKKFKIIGKGNRQSVTGIVVNEKLNIKREEIRELRSILHNCKTKGILADKRNWDKHFQNRLYGKISFFNMVRPDLAEQFKKQADDLDWDAYNNWIKNNDKKQYSEHDRLKLTEEEIKKIIEMGENKYVEFKQTFKWDVKKRIANKDLVKEFSKEIVAFLNNNTNKTQYLFVGVKDDDKSIEGINTELKKLYSNNVDNFITDIKNTIRDYIGSNYMEYIDWHRKKIDKKDIIIFTIKFSKEKPAFYNKGKDNEGFIIRHLNGKEKLKLSEMNEYIKRNWWNI